MKLICWIAIIIAMAAVVRAAGENGQYQIESDLFGKSSPIKLLMQGMLQDGQNTELSTYIKVFNQVFPLLKAFTSGAKDGQAVKEYRYQWCYRDDRGNPYVCADFVWNFLIGWRANQFSDSVRFYNLTIVPYAIMNGQVTFSTESNPVKLSIGPAFNFLDFTAPLSFEMVNKDTLCYSGSMSISPITINAGVSASFLECRITIPEDVQECSWTNRLGARFFSAQLSDGYASTLLDRTCVHSG